jgi:hypothetical protein
VHDSGDQDSITSQHGFSLSENACDVSAIHSEAIRPFSNEQSSMFSHNSPRLISKLAKKVNVSTLTRSNCRLTANGNQGAFAELWAGTPRYPLQDDFLLHFANAHVAERAQNEDRCNKIEELLNSDTTEELTSKMRPNVVRGYLQRSPGRISLPSTEPPLFTGNADFIVWYISTCASQSNEIEQG